ncbi:MAG: 4'-phosphopantetheinyl transferase superfamily protein [Elainella sp. Prado103]|nr:4'-phosphopantetheinyl transferase superfamily protein [Elainella sp. Prado103]
MFAVPPSEITLLPDQVHVWRAALQPTQAALTRMSGLLSADEQARADRFYFQKDRDRFTLARGILRCILGQYLQVLPQTLQFSYGSTGKPALSHPPNAVHFNVSHSGQLALYAVSLRSVGIDVEQINLDRPILEIAQRFFSVTEQQELAMLPPNLQPIGFFNGWTRKEALLKAIGTGLSLPLDQFSVSLSPHHPPKLLETAWDRAAINQWSIRSVDVGQGYAAAVVAAGTDWQWSGWQFRWEDPELNND